MSGGIIDCRPEGHILESIAAQGFTHKKCLAEWIDNSLDAGATTVAIEFGAKRGARESYVSVKDNGSGTASMRPFFTLGSSERHNTTKLGRYGIGSKDAALLYGDVNSTLTVESVHRGVVRRARANWRDLVSWGWQLPEPQPRPATAHEVGTMLRVEPNVRSMPQGDAWASLLDEIGYLYSAAIKSGAQITIHRNTTRQKPVVVQRWELPPLEGVIDRRLDVDGKGVRVYCGFVPDGPNPRYGFTYYHGFRVIVRAGTSRGCGSYNPSRICGFVELDDSWRLTKNKDDILGADALYAAVELACRPVLERADQHGQSLESAAFEAQVSGLVESAWRGVRARRGHGNKKGSVKQTGTGSAHAKANREQDGGPMRSRATGHVRVQHLHLSSDEIGRVTLPTVTLNLDHDVVASAHREMDVRATAMVALSLLAANGLLREDPRDRQNYLKGIYANTNDGLEAFAVAFGRMLKGCRMDAAALAEATS